MITCWIPLSPDQAGNYLAEPGGRYATLISVDARASLDTIASALGNWDLSATYSWQSGQPTRQQFLIDRWLANLPAPADGKVWMYFEIDFTGDTARTIVSHIEKCVLSVICGSADISYVFEAQQVADNFHPCGPGDPQGAQLPPPSPGPPVSSPWKPAIIGGIAGLALTAIVIAVID
jgi:hypothetical protein